MSTTIERAGIAWDTHLPEEKFLAHLNNILPASIVHSLHRYVTECVPTGGFLRAVLENDLCNALARINPVTREDYPNLFHDMVQVLYNHAPSNCWGSKEAVAAWLKRGEDKANTP